MKNPVTTDPVEPVSVMDPMGPCFLVPSGRHVWVHGYFKDLRGRRWAICEYTGTGNRLEIIDPSEIKSMGVRP